MTKDKRNAMIFPFVTKSKLHQEINEMVKILEIFGRTRDKLQQILKEAIEEDQNANTEMIQAFLEAKSDSQFDVLYDFQDEDEGLFVEEMFNCEMMDADIGECEELKKDLVEKDNFLQEIIGVLTNGTYKDEASTMEEATKESAKKELDLTRQTDAVELYIIEASEENDLFLEMLKQLRHEQNTSFEITMRKMLDLEVMVESARNECLEVEAE